MKTYISFIDSYLKVKVSYISNGPGRQSIDRKTLNWLTSRKFLLKKFGGLKTSLKFYNLILLEYGTKI